MAPDRHTLLNYPSIHGFTHHQYACHNFVDSIFVCFVDTPPLAQDGVPAGGIAARSLGEGVTEGSARPSSGVNSVKFRDDLNLVKLMLDGSGGG